MLKMYLAVLEDVPDHMVPVLIAHSAINAHIYFTATQNKTYEEWLKDSFRKCVVSVNQKQFDKIAVETNCWLGNENTTLNGVYSCAVVEPCDNLNRHKVLQYATLWKPKHDLHNLQKKR